MAKRTANTDLNHDNWDQEEEAEDPGQFKRGTDEELKKRVIKKAARRSNLKSNQSSNESPFSGFSAFGSTIKSPSGFSFLSNLAKSSPEISKAQTLNSTPLATTRSLNNNPKPNPIFSLSSTNNNNKLDEVSKPKTSSVPLTIQNEPKDSEKNVNTKDKEAEPSLMKDLNSSCLNWMQKHFESDPHCDFTPVFADYAKHVENIGKQLTNQDTSDKKETSTSLTIKNQEASKVEKTISIFQLSPKKDTFSVTETKPASSFSISTGFPYKPPEFSAGQSSFSNTSESKPFSFGVNSTDSKPFSFGGNSTDPKPFGGISTDPKPFGGFSINSQPFGVNSTTDPKTFSFGLGNPAVPPKKEEQSKDDEDEDNEPKEPEKAFVEDEALYTIKCKLFFKKEGKFLSQGVGNLFIKNLDGKIQLIIRTDNKLGKILFNIILSSSLPTQKMGENNVMIVCVPYPAFEGTEGAIPVLLRVKDSAKADELLEKINTHKNQDN